ncbi:flagellar biosynthesis protein FlhF [Halobacillus salinarum]|uniref:Flagellar biosynthesis protein FlhF n=1 Tax=Halobacillus salinarum TaxID=2932257 RepID=A0ABY4EGM0_9BACI|nr:flagellar biosynthesis protein FlhF [Halobacillus salinarum]UOQ43038.1 flagellar biosynthesis protein FlhF [Halobacillus salinarum]
MKVKKYQAANMPEVMKKVRQDLGPDAVILNSKNIKVGGFLGMFKKVNTEVVAALDPAPELQKASRAPVEKTGTSQVKSSYSDSEVMQEIKLLKSLVLKQQEDALFSPAYQSLYMYLLSQDVEQEHAKMLTSLADEYQLADEEGNLDKKYMHKLAVDYLKPFMNSRSLPDRQYVHFVGPTGVGKTTTIAKLAAEAVLNFDLKVAFITTDTYRIAAIEQLKTYAKLLNIPLEVAYSHTDYLKAREKFIDYDLVLIDTAGRNYKDGYFVNELNGLITTDDQTTTYLVVSMTSKYQDIKEIYQQFQTIQMNEVIFTKLDEASSIGPLINLLLENEMKLAYLTTGQNVPDDFITASSETVVEKLMEDW